MNSLLFSQSVDELNAQESTEHLEAGQVLFFPDYYFSFVDLSLMSEKILDGKHKNVSYHYKKNKLGGYNKDNLSLEDKLRPFMRAYAEFAFELVKKALPAYAEHLQWGRTSFRPAQISGRALSKRKDDTRLHVDAFPASPVNGLRILRVFCNINPQNEPRVWHLGEPFTEVLQRFAPHIPPYSKFKAQLLHIIKATKTLRSPYDHCMLHLHDSMKLDDEYQKTVSKMRFDFPAQSSWIVFTDQVSHAALSGQHLLEHTFYLPVDNMLNPEQSPLKHLERMKAPATA